MEMDQDFFHMAVLKCRSPGLTQGPSGVIGLLCACMYNRYLQQFLCIVECEDPCMDHPKATSFPFSAILHICQMKATGTTIICREEIPGCGKSISPRVAIV